ncbi:hypothetical protein MF672_045820 [Actinomadura sp. ATCC 31491]|uniref:O-methyltransferase C-terminal domain-containing protein n=1 Tax=Actinomadura luzonensis TaxID=2805427 RepID=A0ABT0G9J2_9ACTN|nr:methyltransferase [Actinomadura luzonensis]MCK2221073.1 hypothetical protein [Actinomadura luzonensis]
MTTNLAAARMIARLNTAYAGARILHTAVELDLFSPLEHAPATLEQICEMHGLHPRLAADFLGALTGLGLLVREGDGYRCAEGARRYLICGRPGYLGGSVLQHGRVHYRLWEDLTRALRDGRAASGPDTPAGAAAGQRPDLDRARRFLAHMDALNAFVAPHLARVLDWSRHTGFLDVGGARGNVAAELVRAHPHLRGAVFDVPGVEPLFDEHMEALGTTGRVTFHGGDFHTDDLPPADVLILGHVLHDWPPETRQALIERAYPAVSPGGALLIYDAMIDDAAHEADAHIRSLICAMIRDGGSEYTVADCRSWVEKAGFRFDRVVPIDTVASDRVLVAVKNG